MSRSGNLAMVCRATALTVLVGAALAAPEVVEAHENHAPLPTKGVTIAGDTIMLSDKAREAIGLTTAKVSLGEIHRTVQVNARVELPWHAQAMITSLVPGRIENVIVRPGETVVAGQELARVASPELELLQLSLRQASGEVALAQKLVEQRTALDKQGVIAGKSLLEAKADQAEKMAALEIARQKLLAIGLDETALQTVERRGEPIPYVAVTSPRGGVVTHADVRIGQVVSPTDHLFHVVDPAMLWIAGDVLESDVRYLKKSQPVTAGFAALPGEVFEGVIEHLRPNIDRQTRTQRIVIAVANPRGHLRPGMSGRVKISVHVTQEAVLCPSDAVIQSRTGSYLLVERMPGKYENRSVRLGLRENGRIEVLKGAFPGDRVVLTGSALLASLLGNEHKARVDSNDDNEPLSAPESAATIAHAIVELPTDQQVLASSPVEGRISKILVEPGQHVEAGQILAEVDSLELRNVQLELLQTQTQSRLMQQSLGRLQDLAGQGVAPQRQLWEVQSEMETLRLRSEGLAHKLGFFGLSQETIDALAEVDLTRSSSVEALVRTVPVRAPAAGVIAALNVVPGQVVHAPDPLVEVYDLSSVWVKAHVFERDADIVQLGQTARITFSAYPDLEATGKVVRISPTMDEGERVLPVWVEVANPDHLLKGGMLARVSILSGTGEASPGMAQLKSVETVK